MDYRQRITIEPGKRGGKRPLLAHSPQGPIPVSRSTV